VSIAARAAKAVSWTFDPTVQPEHDIIREVVLSDESPVALGSTVSVDKARGFVPVFAAIRVLSEAIASLPLQVYQRLPAGKRLAPEHRMYSMLHDAPNPEMTSFVFRETMQAHLESWGNAYAEIEYDEQGIPLYLWPLRPDRMTVYREGGRLIYLYRTPDGGDNRLSRRQVFHVPGMGYDGRIGYSPIHMTRRALALGMAAEEFAGRFYDADARPGVVLKLGPEYDYDNDAKKRLAEAFDATHAGLSKKHRTAVLDEGMDLDTIGFPAEDAQLIEQQQFGVIQACRIFNLTPHMLHALERATFNNVEELGVSFVTYSLTTRLVRWEQQYKLQLFEGDTRHFAEHNVDGLLRGKLEDRMKAYWQMFQMGAISPDEIRAKENLNPRPDGKGDVYYTPVNLQAAGETEVDEELSLLPPLQIVGGEATAQSAKAINEKAIDDFAPLFERITRQVVAFERERIMEEAQRRFAEAS
jgi:HK97 family phage portal protein